MWKPDKRQFSIYSKDSLRRILKEKDINLWIMKSDMTLLRENKQIMNLLNSSVLREIIKE